MAGIASLMQTLGDVNVAGLTDNTSPIWNATSTEFQFEVVAALNDAGTTATDGWSAAKIIAYVSNRLDGLDYQADVLDIQVDATLDPGATPTTGDRYIIEDSTALHANFGTITGVGDGDIVEYDGADFVVIYDVSAEGEGAIAWDRDSDAFKKWTGSTWSGMTTAGESNTASNVGGSGIGVFEQKTGVDLELRKLFGTNGLATSLNGTVVEVKLNFTGLATRDAIDTANDKIAYYSASVGEEVITDIENLLSFYVDTTPSGGGGSGSSCCVGAVRVVSASDLAFTGPWNIDGTTYATKSMAVTSEEPFPAAITFSADGLKAYTVGTTNDTIYQYTLSTAWDVSTGSYATKSLSIAAQETVPSGLTFSTDGLKVYVVGTTNDTIYQYTLSTAWDISTGSYATKSLNVSALETSPQGLVFSSDGLNAYIVGTISDKIHQYTLSTAWDISTGTDSGKFLSVTNEDTGPKDLAFSADGMKAYIIGNQNDDVYQYTLSTAWDISTGTYSEQSFSIGSQDSNPTGLAFSSDGTKAYIIGAVGSSAYQYTIPAATDPSPIDGVTLADSDRVLLTAQSPATDNGVWVAVTATDPSTWTRATDLAAGDSAAGTHIAVDQGTTYYDTLWSNMNDAASDTVGTHDLTFSRIRSV